MIRYSYIHMFEIEHARAKNEINATSLSKYKISTIMKKKEIYVYTCFDI